MRTTLAAVVAAGAVLLAGCGSSGGGTAGEDGVKAGSQEEVLAYENGYQQCTGFSVKDLAQTYNAEEATKQSVAEAVARSNPGSAALHEPTMRGCIDAIDKKPFKPSGSPDPNATGED